MERKTILFLALVSVAGVSAYADDTNFETISAGQTVIVEPTEWKFENFKNEYGAERIGVTKDEGGNTIHGDVFNYHGLYLHNKANADGKGLRLVTLGTYTYQDPEAEPLVVTDSTWLAGFYEDGSEWSSFVGLRSNASNNVSSADGPEAVVAAVLANDAKAVINLETSAAGNKQEDGSYVAATDRAFAINVGVSGTLFIDVEISAAVENRAIGLVFNAEVAKAISTNEAGIHSFSYTNDGPGVYYFWAGANWSLRAIKFIPEGKEDDDVVVVGKVESVPTSLRRIQNADLSDGAYYDLAGRKYNNLPRTKGIFIHNAQKVVVR